MNYCEKYTGLIEDLVEGELDRQNAEQANLHVFACQPCKEQYEKLIREKEIYAHYLFETEPPKDLWKNFQARLDSEKAKTPGYADIPVALLGRRKTIFAFSRLFPTFAAAAAVLLFILGINLFWLKTATVENEGDKSAAETERKDTQSALAADNARDKDVIAPENNAPVVKEIASKTKNRLVAGKKIFSAETVKITPKTVSSGERKKSADKIQPDEEQRRLSLRLENLEKELAGQIEKVELLLRSFRNARTIGSLEIFDVEYERGQARKLLEKNAQLRREAENYGIAYAEELLSRVEPYLLDIANLEANPAPDKVLDIKTRVSNQNIIASLQVYCCAAAQ